MPKVSLQTKISYNKFKALFQHLFEYSHLETRERIMREHYDAAVKELESKQSIVKSEDKIVVEETASQDQQIAGS